MHDDHEATVESEAEPAHVGEMLRWRGYFASIYPVLVVLGVAGLLGPDDGVVFDGWMYAIVVLLPLLAVLGLVALYHMFLAAQAHGGWRYAIEHLIVAVALALVGGIGVLLLPLLIANDITQGVAAYRRERELRWYERPIAAMLGKRA